MSNVAKFLIVVNLILAGVFVGSAANFLGQKDFVQERIEGQREEWKSRYATTEQARATLDEANKRLSAENNTLKNDLGIQRQAATDAKTQAESLSTLLTSQGGSLQRATAALELQNSQLAAQAAEITRINAESTAAKASRDTEHAARVAAEAQVATLGAQLNQEVDARKSAEAVVAEANRKIQDLEAQVASVHAKFPNLDLAGAQPAISPGKVLAADNAMGIVVISLGEEDGLKRGFEYIISRGNQYVATIKITDTQAKKSTGQVVKGMQKSPVQANDTVMNP